MLKQKNKILYLLIIMMLGCALASCSGSNSDSEAQGTKLDIEDAYAGREASDMSGYYTMEEYTDEIMFVDTDVREVADMIDRGETFVFLASYSECPWCNRLVPYLNDAAREAGVHVGYIDTRKNPEWQSNMDIDDYDLFIKRFRNWLEKDEDGKLHLYTPDTYFVKNGKVVRRHNGVTPGADDPDVELTSDQQKQLKKDLAEEFASLD